MRKPSVVFQGIKTGAEIWEIIKHESLNEEDWIKDKEYNFIQYDTKNKNGVISNKSSPVLTAEELEEVKNIMENDLITKEELEKQIIDLKNNQELTIQTEVEKAIDDYTMELLKGGFI